MKLYLVRENCVVNARSSGTVTELDRSRRVCFVTDTYEKALAFVDQNRWKLPRAIDSGIRLENGPYESRAHRIGYSFDGFTIEEVESDTPINGASTYTFDSERTAGSKTREAAHPLLSSDERNAFQIEDGIKNVVFVGRKRR